ncbi:hypothetical protein ALC56_05920 [Trachymyrmex septentrionalis]|uniref:Uncharacterized protein n=1 Tax=Trachymyrmex septentrionalis TaxID=34720 RepID=A0A195FGR3_9HYME|nr:hypothetical protein ALC56_05920 [Trachymyrmex septentrionalis]
MPILRLSRILGVEQGRKHLSVLSINYQYKNVSISSFAGFCCINARDLTVLVYRYNRSRLRRLTRLHLQLAQARLRRVSVLAILSSCIYRPASLTERKVAGLVVAAARSQRYALLLFASVHRETSDDDGNSLFCIFEKSLVIPYYHFMMTLYYRSYNSSKTISLCYTYNRKTLNK